MNEITHSSAIIPNLQMKLRNQVTVSELSSEWWVKLLSKLGPCPRPVAHHRSCNNNSNDEYLLNAHHLPGAPASPLCTQSCHHHSPICCLHFIDTQIAPCLLNVGEPQLYRDHRDKIWCCFIFFHLPFPFSVHSFLFYFIQDIKLTQLLVWMGRGTTGPAISTFLRRCFACFDRQRTLVRAEQWEFLVDTERSTEDRFSLGIPENITLWQGSDSK